MKARGALGITGVFADGGEVCVWLCFASPESNEGGAKQSQTQDDPEVAKTEVMPKAPKPNAARTPEGRPTEARPSGDETSQ